MTKPLVSIIMPVYNGETFLAKSLDSALSQSIGELEVLCVNDGSTDSSGEILAQYAAKDSRVRVFEQPNLGSGPARNLAIDEAQGKYVAFLDSDDFYPNDDTLALLYQKAEENNVMICGGSFSRFLNRIVVTTFSEALSGYTFAEEKRMRFCDYQFDYGYQRFLFNTEFLRQNQLYFPTLVQFEDPPMMVEAMLAAGEFYAVPDVTYRYRHHFQSASPSEWPTYTICDRIRGITQNLITSRQNGLERLHALSWLHLTYQDFYHPIIAAVDRGNTQVIMLMLALFRELDFEMLKQGGVNDHEWIYAQKAHMEDVLARQEKLLAQVKNIEPASSPLVTVVMPSLNVEPFIRQCVESVMQQTLTDLEILCIDAGSTDGTLEILQEYAAADRRIRVIQANRKSYGLQVNMGIREARGRYLAIVETDDYIPDNMYASLSALMQEHHLEAVRADYTMFGSDGNNRLEKLCRITPNKAAYHRVITGEDILNLMPRDLPMGMLIWSGMYDTEFLRQNNIFCQETPGASYQDNGFYFRLLMQVKRFMFVNTPFYYLRRDNPNSSVMSSAKIDCIKEEYDFIRAHIEMMQESPFKQKLIRFCSYYRFIGYLFTFDRIRETDRLAFLQGISREFHELEQRGELDLSLMKPRESRKLAAIMEDPVNYYNRSSTEIRNYYINGGKPLLKPVVTPVRRTLMQKVFLHSGKALIYLSKNGLRKTVARSCKVVWDRMKKLRK